MEISGLPGQTIYVKVESCNAFGVSSTSSDRFARITLRSSSTPKDVIGLEIAGTTVTGTDFDGKDCKVQWKRSTGAISGFSSGTIYNEFLDYKVEVVVSGKTVRYSGRDLPELFLNFLRVPFITNFWTTKLR